jgi:hypothetical protein
MACMLISTHTAITFPPSTNRENIQDRFMTSFLQRRMLIFKKKTFLKGHVATPANNNTSSVSLMLYLQICVFASPFDHHDV